MNETCSFCLEPCTDFFQTFDRDIKDVMRTIFPNKDVGIFKTTIICTGCLNCLKSVYGFITTANENHHKINNINVDYTTVIENYNICQTCSKPMKVGGIYLFDHIENVVPFYEIKEMLDYCSLDLDIEEFQCPVICNACWEKLRKCYYFLKRYTENENQTPETRVKQSGAMILNNTQEDHGIQEIKVEFDEDTIKEELSECDLVQNISDDSSGLITATCKEERTDQLVGKQLYVKLERQNLHRPLCKKLKKRNKMLLEVHKCRLCPYATSKRYALSEHMKTHMTLQECADKGSLYECHDCTYRTKRKTSLIRHFKEVHRSAYVCEKCDFETNVAESFYRHLREEHNNIAFSYACHSCPYVACTKLKLRQHTKLHDLENIILKCGQCDFETREMSNLEQHKIHHKTVRIKNFYKCALCPFEVKKKSSMDRHLVTHFTRKELGEKLYGCYHCKYRSKRKDSLALHIRKLHKL